MVNFLQSLIEAAEKAGWIARACSSDCAKEALLVAEKVEGANARFDKDFKTIADVLAQESARKIIETKYPELRPYIRGEECEEIGGIRIILWNTLDQTINMLSNMLPAGPARHIADAVHFCPEMEPFIIQEDIPEIDTSEIGLWIDPIDGTAEFISGVRGESDEGEGLQCVTVLIGAYKRATGEPMVGVINQPFQENSSAVEPRILWGVCVGDIKKWGGSNTDAMASHRTMLMSAAEKEEIKNKFENAGWNVKSIPGAGNKLMRVVLGEADAYIVSQATTYRWDTCAPHAIIRARGGDIVDFQNLAPLTYKDHGFRDPKYYCNKEGIVAYLNPTVFEEIKTILKK